jgi:hypothetical protein
MRSNSVTGAKEYDDPAWIKMMDDPKVDYFDAVKNYERFWKNKIKPLDEQEVISEHEARLHTKATPSAKRRAKRADKEKAERLKYRNYAYDCNVSSTG